MPALMLDEAIIHDGDVEGRATRAHGPGPAEWRSTGLQAYHSEQSPMSGSVKTGKAQSEQMFSALPSIATG
jgi:hypothetical protein